MVGSPTCYWNCSASSFSMQYCKSCLGLIAHCVGANNVPRSIEQCRTWCENWHRLVNSSIPWVLQLSAGQFGKRATLCFEGKSVTNPVTIVCFACSLMSYWAGSWRMTRKLWWWVSTQCWRLQWSWWARRRRKKGSTCWRMIRGTVRRIEKGFSDACFAGRLCRSLSGVCASSSAKL